MSRTLFVGNLPHEVIQEAELRALFQQFGELEEIRVRTECEQSNRMGKTYSIKWR
jgi:RNA recognition motif-containing protein